MTLKDHIARLWIYNDWANRQTLNSLQRSQHPPPKSVQRMGHLIGAEEIWSQRLSGIPTTARVWPDLPLEACTERLDALKHVWEDLLATIEFGTTIRYTNTKGSVYTNMVEDIMTHVVMHQAHHRGQIASDLRENGDTPAITDYIFYLRDH